MEVEYRIKQYRTHISEKIKSAATILEPFPYLVVDDFLPSELARLLCEEYRDPNNFTSSKDALFYNNPNRFADNIDGKGGAREKLSNYLLFGIYNEGLIPSTLISKFRVDHKISKLHFRGQVTRDTENYSLGVHTDTINKLFTLIVYLNSEYDPSFSGTSIFASPLGLESDGYLMYPKEFFVHVKEINPIFNRALIFRRCSTSFHGVLKHQTTIPRFTLQLNYFFKG
jgi:hypothetical protein